MTRNDGFFKFLFALEIALLPVVILSHIYFESWTMGLFIGAIFICRVWREFFKEKGNRTHSILNSALSSIMFTFLLIYIMFQGYVNVVLGIFTIILITLYNLFKELTFSKKISETIMAVDFCNVIFECMTLLALAFVTVNAQFALIGLWSIILTSSVSVGYKLVYLIKYNDLFGKIKNIFRKH